jgi:class 3 adenylate cyclase
MLRRCPALARISDRRPQFQARRSQLDMPNFFNNLSIRNKLIVLIGGTVSLLTASVLALVWVQSLKQARSIVQEQLDTSRQLFDSAQQARYRARAFETASNAAQSSIEIPLERRDRGAACAEVARLMEEPSSSSQRTPGFVSIRLPDGAPLALGVKGHPACDPKIMSWRLPDVHETKPGVPEITTWSSPEKKLYRVFAAAVPGHAAAIGTFSFGAEENDDLARAIKQRAGVDVVLWQEDDANPPRVIGISDAKLQSALTAALAAQPELRRPFSFQAADGEYEVEEVIISENGMAMHNPGRVRSALVSSVTQRMQPFRVLEWYLASLAVAALLLGVCVGFIVSRPISMPLVNLADAAREIEQGKYDAIEQIRSGHAGQAASADEIATLSRAFVEMAGGLKQRFAMSKYMSRSAYQMLEQDGAGPAAERKWLALVFSDVRGFTAFSDDRDPALVIERMNDVLGLEADAVRRYGGDVDKFVGDAMFAWFSGADRCTRAVAAAAEIVAALDEKFGGKAGTQIGFGIHVGEVVVGSMGSQDRRDYTAIGRSVNLASRLCSAAEAGQILVSQAVATELEGAVTLNPLPAVTAKGFSEPVRVFEVDLTKHEAPVPQLK